MSNINLTNFNINKHENIFIYQKELRALLHNLKTKAFEFNGILYGDIVINSIIAKFYKDKFLHNNNNFNDFWNNNIDLNTIARTITSNNFDVYFKNFNDYMKFYNFIITDNNFNIVNTTNLDSFNFISNKYIINTKIGKTITWTGIDIKINLNISTSLPNEKNIEPPFNLSFFTTDLLILTKENNGPRLSKNTGIQTIDNMNIVDKNILFANIIKNLCNFNISIISNNLLYNNDIAIKSINFINNGWYINNLPFILKNNNLNNYDSDNDNENNNDNDNDTDNNSNICMICLEKIKNNNLSFFINNNKQFLHSKCLLKYLSNILDENKDLICPFRQKILFINNNNDFINLTN